MLKMITHALVLAFFAAIPSLADDLSEELLAQSRKGNVSAVKALLDKGADINSRSSYGQTPLFFACDRGHTELVKLLLDKGADVNATDTFYKATALTWASSKGHVGIVKMLIAKGAQGVDAVLVEGVQKGNAELAAAALETGKVKSNTLNYAMSMAVKAKKDDMVELLKKAGVPPPSAKPAAPVAVDAAVLESYTGKYTGGRGGTEMEFVVSLKDGQLTIVNPAGGPLSTLAAISPTQFRVAEVEGLEIEFVAQQGKVTAMNATQAGNTREFKRVTK